jgi:DNA-binding HxlR family transcriptional regulator
MEYLHHGMRAAKREDGTLNAETHTGVTMNKRGKRVTEALPLMCRNDESKAVREFLTKVGDKWSILLVVMLARAPQSRARFSELQRMVDGISQRMLTTTLRNLERDGFVSREVFPEVPPRVEYELTSLGKSLLEPMELLVDWIGGNWNSIKEARVAFDKRG